MSYFTAATADRQDTARAAHRSAVRAEIWSRAAVIPQRIARLIESADVAAVLASVHVDRSTDTIQSIADRDRELLNRAHAGDTAAATALYVLYLNLIESVANTYGSMAEKNNRAVVFDADDAHQEAATVLMEIIADGDNGKDFAGRFESEVRSVVGEEAWRHLRNFPVARDAARMVMDAVDLFDGDLDAASNYLATVPPARRRISRERFFAVLMAIDPERVIRLDAPIGDDETPIADLIEDETTAADFAAVLGEADDFDSADLVLAWSSLSERERRIVTLRTGLTDEPRSQTDVAAELGVSQQAVSKALRIALSKLRAALGVQPTPAPAKPRRPHTKKAVVTYVFDVLTRSTTDARPAPSSEGVTNPLRIRR